MRQLMSSSFPDDGTRLRDLSLLNDETFVTWLRQIRDRLLQRRASRSSKLTFRSVAEPILLDYLKAKVRLYTNTRSHNSLMLRHQARRDCSMD